MVYRGRDGFTQSKEKVMYHWIRTGLILLSATIAVGSCGLLAFASSAHASDVNPKYCAALATTAANIVQERDAGRPLEETLADLWDQIHAAKANPLHKGLFKDALDVDRFGVVTRYVYRSKDDAGTIYDDVLRVCTSFIPVI